MTVCRLTFWILPSVNLVEVWIWKFIIKLPMVLFKTIDGFFSGLCKFILGITLITQTLSGQQTLMAVLIHQWSPPENFWHFCLDLLNISKSNLTWLHTILVKPFSFQKLIWFSKLEWIKEKNTFMFHYCAPRFLTIPIADHKLWLITMTHCLWLTNTELKMSVLFLERSLNLIHGIFKNFDIFSGSFMFLEMFPRFSVPFQKCEYLRK